MNHKTALIVDDDPITRALVQQSLLRAGFKVSIAPSGEEALDILTAQSIAVLISDIRMWGMDGFELVRSLKLRKISTVTILMTGYGSLEGAVSAIKYGAFDYISKPIQPLELIQIAERAWGYWVEQNEGSGQTRQSAAPKKCLQETKFIGSSSAMVNVYKLVARAALTECTVLISGESGTGKELVARAIHGNGPRAQKPFLAVNCGAIADSLLESELFGYVKGAFTGAVNDRKGLFEEASGGTLFLDEVGDLSLSMQVKLLRVLQYGEIKPVGSPEIRKLDTRVVAATHRDLKKGVLQGTFREDLFYRLNVIGIELPSLRDRQEDITELAEYFLNQVSEKTGRVDVKFSHSALELLRSYSWPGNIRELEHAVEFAMAMAPGNILFPENFPKTVQEQTEKILESTPAVEKPLEQETLLDAEKNQILSVLSLENQNRTRAARRLGIDRVTLYRKMWKHQILRKA